MKKYILLCVLCVLCGKKCDEPAIMFIFAIFLLL